MVTSSRGNIFRVTGPCAGNSPVTGEFSSPRPVTRSFDVFIDLRLNKVLSKQSWGWWSGTSSRSLWRDMRHKLLVYDMSGSIDLDPVIRHSLHCALGESGVGSACCLVRHTTVISHSFRSNGLTQFCLVEFITSSPACLRHTKYACARKSAACAPNRSQKYNLDHGFPDFINSE